MSFSGQTAIIAGSGMYTDDRIVNRLKHGLYDPKNDLFFVGYQAKGTPAKAAIHRLSGYSAHADQKTLCDWVKSMPKLPGRYPAGAWRTQSPKITQIET